MYTGVIAKGKVQCKVNDELRQDADLADMIWGFPKSFIIFRSLSKSVRAISSSPARPPVSDASSRATRSKRPSPGWSRF